MRAVRLAGPPDPVDPQTHFNRADYGTQGYSGPGRASLVATAEGLGLAEIFTLDHHFQVYRLKGSRPFVIVG